MHNPQQPVSPSPEFSSNRPVLIVPDVHQDLGFLDRAVQVARSAGATLCFLGDHVDAIGPQWRGDAALHAVAERLPELAETHPHGCVFLVGNHDVDALRVARLRSRHLLDGKDDLVAKLDAAQPSAPAYARLLGAWPSAFLRTWGIAAAAHGYLLSHAGVSRRHWPFAASPRTEQQTEVFLRETHAAWTRFLASGEETPLFAAGPARGGRNEPVGGPLWLDWNAEFVDDLPLPQIVGHTRAREPRRKDRSWCIDAAQSAVALLDPDSGLRVLRV
jgi:hypothetical protein